MSEHFKVLIAYDGSNCADAALDDLKNAGLAAEQTEALIVSVAEVWLPPQDDTGTAPEFGTVGLQKKYDEGMEILAKAKDRAARAVERLRVNFPQWTVTAEATYGSPAWEILFRAGDFKPDLIVAGSQGRTAFERVLLGSVSQKIVTEAECSVRVARGRVEVDESPARIILGYDGSAGADETVKTVCRRNWKAGSEVKVLIVQDPAMIRNSLDVTTDKFAEAGGRVVADLEARGVKASLEIKEGNPKHVIVEEAENWRADSIFVGAARFENSFTKYLLGSVSSAIVARALLGRSRPAERVSLATNKHEKNTKKR